MQKRLESLDADEHAEQMALFVLCKRLAVLPGLDDAAQPNPLLVIRDVLDLVCDGAAVCLAEFW